MEIEVSKIIEIDIHDTCHRLSEDEAKELLKKLSSAVGSPKFVYDAENTFDKVRETINSL